MPQKIRAWVEYGPRLAPIMPVDEDTVINNTVLNTNQSRGSVLAVLAESDKEVEAGLKDGRAVHLPNGTIYRPVAKKDGSIEIKVRVSPEMVRRINTEFKGRFINADNKGKTDEEIFALWDADHPTDPIER